MRNNVRQTSSFFGSFLRRFFLRGNAERLSNNFKKKMSCLCGSDVEIHDLCIKCDECFRGFHYRCLKLFEHQQYDILSYKCLYCKPPNGKITYKKRTNWHRYDWADENADEKPVETGTVSFTRKLISRHFPSADGIVSCIHGSLLSKEYLITNGFHRPILVNKTDGLGLIVPPNTYSLDSITAGIGKDRVIEVIDVGRQSDVKMTLGDFITYFKSTKNQTKILNVISLEFSDTPLASYVEPPFIVRKICWVTNYWPTGGESIREKPQVSKYCLLSPAGAYTDFHIDFGGSSVWYHVLRGEKYFYLVPPTPENLSAYESWNSSSTHYETFFGDLVSQCYKLVVKTGQTLFIPTGWIHAVLTTKDTVVFGGNYLHSFNIELQLKVYEIEKRTSAPVKFCFPRFEAVNWYAGTELLEDLNEGLLGAKPASYLIGLKHLFYTLLLWGRDKEGNLRKDPYPSNLSLARFLPDLSAGLTKIEVLITAANADPARCVKPVSYERDLSFPVQRPMNGIEELLMASKFAGSPVPDSTDDSESDTPFKEAVVGMLSLNRHSDDESSDRRRSKRKPKRKPSYERDIDDTFRQVHQDDDFVYPSLEPEENDGESSRPKRKLKRKKGKSNSYTDGAWNPNIRIRGVLPKHERPVRSGAKIVAVEKVLEDARESEHVPVEVNEPSSSHDFNKRPKRG